ncbi:MAG: succinate--CoA ligase subunit alpha [Alcaligenaceae bacterium]|nr:succinate--CoA ligase subunit alpha [Alcaligenaceae bacterium]
MTTHVFPNDPLALLFDPTAPLPTIVQGITGRMGRKHAALMRAYGTDIVGGTAPAGSKSADLKDVDGAPVFRSCAEAVKATGAVASVAMVPPFEVLAAISEAVAGGIKLIVTVTEGMPVADAIRARLLVQAAGARWVGASTPGVAVPGRTKLGFIPSVSLHPGSVGVIAKSGTLSYETNHRLVDCGLGQSVWIGVGGDACKGTRFAEVLPFFNADSRTKQIVLVGEIGGSEEEEFAQALIDTQCTKPTFAVIAGHGAREGVVMGHAGAVVHGNTGTFDAKKRALEGAGARVFASVDDLIKAMLAAH